MSAKSKDKAAQPVKSGKSVNSAKPIDELVSKYFWLVIPVLTILYFMYKNVSVGFYQDDEIAQYINMINFWHDPAVVLGNFAKPGYKIFLVVPAYFGYNYVLLVNSLISASTVYLTYVLLKTYKINYAAIGALLLATQPMFLELSFRSYSEIFTSFCFVLFLILYKKEKFFLSATLLGFIFTVRQESALLMIVMAILFIRDKRYKDIIALAIFPVIYTILGYLKTGDILYIITEMRAVAGLNYKSQGLMHYFKVYVFIVGPVCLSLFLLGFFGFFKDIKNYKKYISDYFLFYVIFVIIFITQMLTMINDGPNPGNWRYLLHISPICAFFATVGLNNLADSGFKKINYYITGIFALLVLLFLSKATDGFILLDQTDYTKLIFVILFLGLSAALWSNSKFNYLNKLSITLVILAALHLYFGVQPRKLSPENVAVKETSDYVSGISGLDAREKLSNHTMIQFYSPSYRTNPLTFKKLDSKELAAAPKGTIVIWDSHYSYRPEFQNDVKLETIEKDSADYKLLKQIVSNDRRFGSYIFEKQ